MPEVRDEASAIQTWTGPQEFQEVGIPRTSTQSANERGNVVSPVLIYVRG